MTINPRPKVAEALSPESRVELDALTRLLRRASGFALAVAIVNDEGLCDRLIDDADGILPGALVVRLADGDHAVVDQIEAALRSTRPSAVFLVGLEHTIDLNVDRAPRLDALNLNRDYVAKLLGCPLVIWGPEWLAREIARRAVDLWSVRSSVVVLRSASSGEVGSSKALKDGLDWDESPRRREAREETLRALLDDARAWVTRDPAYLAEVHAALGSAAQFRSAYGEARDHLTAARDTYTQIGNRLGQATAQSELGRLNAKVGNAADAAARLRDAAGIYRAIGLTNQARQAEAEADALMSPAAPL